MLSHLGAYMYCVCDPTVSCVLYDINSDINTSACIMVFHVTPWLIVKYYVEFWQRHTHAESQQSVGAKMNVLYEARSKMFQYVCS